MTKSRPINRIPENWTPEKIISDLNRKKITRAAIARAVKRSPVTVNDVVRGIKNSKLIHEAIAEALGKDIKEIWPAIYLHGDPRRGRRQTNWNRQAA